MDYPHSLDDVFLHAGKFTDGTPDGTIPPSRDPAEWANAVTDEILGVIVAAGGVPDEADHGQLAAAIAELIAAAIAGNVPDLAGYAQLALAQLWTKAQRGAVVALEDGATITPDFSLGNNFALALAGARVLANPTNLAAGQSGVISITETIAGCALAFGSHWKFAGGAIPGLPGALNAKSDLAYFVKTPTEIVARLISDVQ
ncbi:MAG: hypothetical protein HYU60_05285 [Magnetospirillum sp.]|nr:hypothetical protein [Magnetospirillum sp.]